MAKVLNFLLLVLTIGLMQDTSAADFLKIPLNSKSVSLDPRHLQDISSLLVSRQINCQLIRNNGGIYHLEAAKSIKYITPLKIQITIDNTRKFSDGSFIKAEDVVASFNYTRNSRAALRNIFQWISRIDVLNNNTIILILKKPVPQILTVLAAPNYAIFKKSFLEKAAMKASAWQNPVSCGGYKILEFVGDHIKLSPMKFGLPIVFYLNNANEVRAEDIDQYDIVSLKLIGVSQSTKNFNVINLFDPSQIYIGLNSLKAPWVNQLNRCNFLSKINPEKILKTYGSSAQLANDFLPNGALGYDPHADFMKKVILENKGNSVTKKTTFCLAYLVGSVPEKLRHGYLSAIKSIYSNVRVFLIPSAKQFAETFRGNDCDALIFSLKSNYFDGYEYLNAFVDKDGNVSGYRDMALSERINNSQNIIDPMLRAKEYRQIINKVESLCLVRPLLTVSNRTVYIRKSLKAPGLGNGPFNDYYLGNIMG